MPLQSGTPVIAGSLEPLLTDGVLAAGQTPTLERELKFVLPAARAPFLRSWLPAVCRPDPVHPPGRVTTVYFDTPDLRLLDEKVNSDYLKTKVRVRWYGRSAPGGPDLPVFLEAKLRVGAARHKVRAPAVLSAAEAAGWSMGDPRWRLLLAPLRALVPDLPGDLTPSVRLAYVRDRFQDRFGPGRVTLDSDIRLEAADPARIGLPASGMLAVAVLEYKGHASELPPHLAPILRAGARRASCSKYLECCRGTSRGAF